MLRWDALGRRVGQDHNECANLDADLPVRVQEQREQRLERLQAVLLVHESKLDELDQHLNSLDDDEIFRVL